MRKLCNLAELACYGYAVSRVLDADVNGFLVFLGIGIAISIVKKIFPLK